MNNEQQQEGPRVDANLVIEELLKQIAALSKENAVLRAQIIMTPPPTGYDIQHGE
jgi:hypothetical protein